MSDRVKELEGVIARANAAVRDMYEQAEITPVPIEWERRLDDLDEALRGACSVKRGDKEWEEMIAENQRLKAEADALRERLAVVVAKLEGKR